MSNVVRLFTDSLMNLVSGLGVTATDKSANFFFTTNELDKGQLEAMYRGDWISRKVVRVPADDATRNWRSWQAEGDQVEQIEALEMDQKIQQKVNQARTLERLYGGAALILGVQGSGGSQQELNLDRLGQDCLQFVHVVSRHEITTADGQIETDLTSPYYGQPKMWSRQPLQGERTLIHPSRVLMFAGERVPDPALAIDSWGDSALQALYDAIVGAGLVSQGTASLINEMKMDIMKIKNLSAQLSTDESTSFLRRRIELVNQMKSNNRITLLDSEDEWDSRQISFASMPQLLQMYLTIASGAADIPVTRMLGQSPRGLNATGDHDTRNYYDKIKADQDNIIAPAIRILDEVLVISATGSRDPNIYYEWDPLWQMNDAEKADIALKKSQVMSADVAAMLIPTDALAKARENQLIEDGTYPGLEAALADTSGEIVDPAMEQQLKNQQQLSQQSHQQAQEMQAQGHANAIEMQQSNAKTGDAGFDPNQARDPHGLWTKVGGQMGSNPGGVYADPSGQHHYVKFYRNPEQGRAEVLASNIYNRMGIRTTQPRIETVNGKEAVVSPYEPNLERMHPDDMENLKSPHQLEQLARMEAAAKLTGNRDIVGLEHDNILHDPATGDLVSIDQGGTFQFRAQGGPKDYGPSTSDIAFNREGSASAAVFSQLDPETRARAARDVAQVETGDLFASSGMSNAAELHQNYQQRKRKVHNDAAPKKKRYYRTIEEAQDAAGEGQVVVRMRVSAEDAEKLL